MHSRHHGHTRVVPRSDLETSDVNRGLPEIQVVRNGPCSPVIGVLCLAESP